MTSLRSVFLPLSVVFLLVVSACGDSTAPDLGELDPAAVNQALTLLVQPLRASQPVNLNLAEAYDDLITAGMEFDRAVVSRPLRAAVRLGMAEAEASVGPLAVTIPPELEGQTFVYDMTEGEWVVDETREDAPADGVRVEWYEVDATNELRLPVTVQGHADLTPAELSGLEGLRVQAVETAGGEALGLMDFLQAAEVVEATQWSQVVRIEGEYSDDTSGAEFSVTSETEGDDDADIQEYTYDASLEDAQIRYGLTAAGADSAEGYEDDVVATAVFDGSTTVLELTFTGSAEGDDVVGTLVHDGELLANVSAEGNQYRFRSPDGGEFGAAETTDLNNLFRNMLLVGFQPLFYLPVFSSL